MKIVLTLAAIFVLVCTNELWWHFHKKHNEFSRKFVHVSVGVYAAFWPFYLSFNTIKYLAALGVLVLIFSKYFNVLKAIHSVERKTWGVAFSGISVIVLAFLTHNKWIYAASLLQMALADGLAAVIGVAYGRKNQYKVFGHTKSVIGSLAFFACSFIILLTFNHFGHLAFSAAYLALISFIATGLENGGVKGLDNIFVPIFVLLMIR